ncbi:2-dehydro-3-deoxygalactonokinase [Pseudomonas sp. PIC25]|uniref:2-dehydro-3-deoxygalactonokinase n=1 Tax=Pseudomonas sp. PIC25 TaxID=1958773 RepID=UPI000BABFFA7|nr:2-dehydro-3-deoxygalactonokinase [Pseudomonas sp. PIC25]PAU64340.1 2-dehydro-3-deoxygalactonokinase [Pseudomonas sp. PIC25]
MRTHLIALDWGTTSLRAYRLGVAGETLEERSLARGILQLDGSGDAAFEGALDEACGDWLDAEPGVPLIACGMVGSAQGWREAAYVDVPLDDGRLAAALTPIETRRGNMLWVIPGAIQQGPLPNVMRGEETQVFGLLAGLGEDERDEPLLIGLPGSHSKWVTAEDGRLGRFHTFMTGEVYAALLGHTLLGRTVVPCDAFDAAAFEEGVRVARSDDGRGGPLSTIFSSRTRVLTGSLRGESQADYLSGLLIGHELMAMAEVCQADPHQRIVLVGNSALCARYLWALEHSGFCALSFASQATAAGLWRIAERGGLLAIHPVDEVRACSAKR